MNRILKAKIKEQNRVEFDITKATNSLFCASIIPIKKI